MAFSHGTPNSIVANGLVSYIDAANIKCYSRSGAVVNNLTNTVTGSLSATAMFETGNFGTFDFDGASDYIDCGNITEINGATALTFNLWYKYTSDMVFEIIAGKNVTDSSTNTFQLYNWGSGVLYVWVKSGGVGTVSYVSNYSSLVSVDQWNMLTITYDGGENEIKAYLNGSSTNIINVNGTTPDTFPNISDVFFIGKGINTTGFRGQINPFSIYNRILTSSETLQNYNALKYRFE